MNPFPQGKFAAMVKLGPKGQVVIPKEAREMLNIAPGDTVLLLCDREQGLAIPSPERTAAIAQAIFGPEKRGEEAP